MQTVFAKLGLRMRADRAPTAGHDHADRAGFTLLELVTVIAIMILLLTLSVGSYRGFVRGAGMAGAVANLRATVSLARQFAVTHRTKTYIYFDQDGMTARYLVCAQEGRHEGPDDSAYLHVLTPRWEPDALHGGTVYNLTDGSHGEVTDNSDRTIQAQLSGGGENRWDRGDRFGWAVHDDKRLPSGIVFGDGSASAAPDTIVFNADGTTELGPGQAYVLQMCETHGNGVRVLTVNGLTGRVEEQ